MCTSGTSCRRTAWPCRGGDRDALNIGSGAQTSTSELFDILCGLTGRVGLLPEYAPERDGEVRRICLDAGRARRVLGWAPAHSLYRDGLTRVVQSLESEPQDDA